MGTVKNLFGLPLSKAAVSATSIPLVGLSASLARPPTQEYQIMVNYNGQADLLLSLQIPPDYYPYQFKRKRPYDHLTDTHRYMVVNPHVSDQKKDLGKRLQSRINALMSNIKEYGPSLWDKDLYASGLVQRNSQFWNSKRTNLLFLEQYISDDYPDIRNSYSILPSHRRLIITNHRAARDPYTIFSRKVFECFQNKDSCSKSNSIDQKIYVKFQRYMDTYNHESSNSLHRFGKFIDFWNNLMKNSGSQLKKLKFDTIIDKSTQNLFSLDPTQDQALAREYLNAVFSHEEICVLNKWAEDRDGDCHHNHDHDHQSWDMHYLSPESAPKQIHHPSLEQHLIPGTAPLSEGSQKDIIVFLYQFAAAIHSYTQSPEFQSHFGNDYRKEAMEQALNNAYQISKNIDTRIGHIRDYFQKIQVVDPSFDPSSNNYTTADSKTLAILSFSPTAYGAGEATIQSMSKFPWLYRDIGLRQPLPKNPSDYGSVFSVDDGGWWWKVGSANLNPSSLLKFRGSADTLLILANEDDWNLIQDNSSNILHSSASLLKNSPNPAAHLLQGREPRLLRNINHPISYSRHHLWNEGLGSPIALNLLLDNLVDIFQRQYHSALNDHQTEYRKAMDWGDYWTTHFLNGTHTPERT